MTIFVNLPSLRSSSKDIEASATSLDSSGNSLLAAARGAPSYDDQFAPWVQGIAAEARGKSKLHAADVSNLGKRVGRKGEEFAAADQAGSAQIPQANSSILGLYGWNWLHPSGFWDVFFLRFKKPWFVIPQPSAPPNQAEPWPRATKLDDFDPAAVAYDGRLTLDEWGPAKKTLEKNSDKVALYPRAANKEGFKSNCTWYVAAAIYSAKGIALNKGEYGTNGGFAGSLGGGGKWGPRAQTAKDNPEDQYHSYIESVDKKPMAGSAFDIAFTQGGHVMFVQETRIVEGPDGKKMWELVVSEENYYLLGEDTYKNSFDKDAERVLVGDDTSVVRWERTFRLPMDEDGDAVTDGSFIHFK
ncbi:MAG: hypothetical protein KIS88_00550 [Anaerolineales bacterium]|nr:hypothetical protein [Anaerolineales bacterium]